MKVYIASPFFNERQLNDTIAVENACHNAEWEFYSPRLGTISKHYGSLNESDDPYKIYLYKSMVFAEDIIEIDSSDLVLVNYDGKDSGTLFELGYALAKDKIVICSSNDPKVRLEFKKVLSLAKRLNNMSLNKSIFFIKGERIIKDDISSWIDEDRSIVIAEHDGSPYLGLSKILLGIMYAKLRSSSRITYIDTPRKSNLMLTSSVEVYECNDLSIFDELDVMTIDSKLSQCTPVLEYAKDE